MDNAVAIHLSEMDEIMDSWVIVKQGSKVDIGMSGPDCTPTQVIRKSDYTALTNLHAVKMESIATLLKSLEARLEYYASGCQSLTGEVRPIEVNDMGQIDITFGITARQGIEEIKEWKSIYK